VFWWLLLSYFYFRLKNLNRNFLLVCIYWLDLICKYWISYVINKKQSSESVIHLVLLFVANFIQIVLKSMLFIGKWYWSFLLLLLFSQCKAVARSRFWFSAQTSTFHRIFSAGSTASHRMALCVVCVVCGVCVDYWFASWPGPKASGKYLLPWLFVVVSGWMRSQGMGMGMGIGIGSRTCTDLVDSPCPSPALGLYFTLALTHSLPLLLCLGAFSFNVG